MLTALTGALAGLIHVLSGPDHLAAVAPLAAAERRRGWLAGCRWGVGHASGVVVVGVLAVMLRDLLPPIEIISAWSERLVGVALIGVGLWALHRSVRVRPAPHAHASFYFGVLHGIAGSSHFLGVLPALAFPTRSAALTYIGAFGAGTVIAMTAFAAVIGFTANGTRTHPSAYRALMTTAALLAMAVGAAWIAG